jgi:hypothetical protein
MGAAHKALYEGTPAAQASTTTAAQAMTAFCKSGVFTVKYFSGANCSGTTAPTWTPANTNTDGELSCFPDVNIRHADCSGVDQCSNSAHAFVKHLKAEQPDTKTCGKKVAGDATTQRCTKACICPADKSDTFKHLNAAMSGAACFNNPTTHPGQYAVSLQTQLTFTAGTGTPALAAAPGPAATGSVITNVDAGTYAFSYAAWSLAAQVHTIHAEAALNYDTSLLGAGDTEGTYKCGKIDADHVTASAATTVDLTSFTGTAATRSYAADHDGIWTATGCGYKTKQTDSGGAHPKFTLGAAAILAALAAIF